MDFFYENICLLKEHLSEINTDIEGYTTQSIVDDISSLNVNTRFFHYDMGIIFCYISNHTAKVQHFFR